MASHCDTPHRVTGEVHNLPLRKQLLYTTDQYENNAVKQQNLPKCPGQLRK